MGSHSVGEVCMYNVRTKNLCMAVIESEHSGAAMQRGLSLLAAAAVIMVPRSPTASRTQQAGRQREPLINVVEVQT